MRLLSGPILPRQQSRSHSLHRRKAHQIPMYCMMLSLLAAEWVVSQLLHKWLLKALVCLCWRSKQADQIDHRLAFSHKSCGGITTVLSSGFESNNVSSAQYCCRKFHQKTVRSQHGLSFA